MSQDVAALSEQYSILLATYNGSAFIADFLASCPLTKGADIIVRDDGSSDDTLAVIEEFCMIHNIPLTLLQGDRLGAIQSFGKLLERLEKPYFFLADQDDIWEKEKFSILFKAMHELEEQYGDDTPLLVYSDASMMHADGKIFHNSWLKIAMIPYGWNTEFRNVLVMPHAIGCTMLGNKALARAAVPIAPEAIMHDAWLLQIAGALGAIKEVSKPLVRYRQHASNTCGVKKSSLLGLIQRVLDGRKPKYENIVRSQRQAQALLYHCGDLMPEDKRQLCKAWADAQYKSWIKRRLIYAQYGFKKAGFMHNAVLWTCG